MCRNSGKMAEKTYKSKTTPETWQTRYDTASGSQTKMFKRFANWYDSLYAVIGITPAPWRSKMYVPVLARQTWALVSKFLNLKPGFEVRIQDDSFDDEELEQKVEKAQRKLEFDYENPYLEESMRDKLFAPLLDAVVTGTGLAKVCWKVEDRVTYSRLPSEDGTVDLSKEKKTTKQVAYNDLEPVNIFNVFVSPSATNLYSAPWIIIKEFKSIKELKAINKAKGVDMYKNLDKLGDTTDYDDAFNSYDYSRNRLTNQPDKVDKTVNMVKIFECYEGDSICTYAEGSDAGNNASDQSWVLLREQKNPYWHGKYPLVKFHVKNRPFQFWGEGLFETTYRIQVGYNDAFNHYMDQWNLSENSMLMTPENAHVNDYVVEPGGTITYRGDDAPTQFKHQPPDANALQGLLGLMDQAIEGVTISNYASGIPNSETDKTKGTATGIKRLQDAAGDLVGFMRANFQQSITQVGRMWLSNNQQFMQEPITLPVNHKGKKESLTVTPQDMQGDMDLVVDDASMEAPSREDQQASRVAFTQQLMAIKQAADQQTQLFGTPPMGLNYPELAEDLAEKFGLQNFNSVLIPEAELQQAAQQHQQTMMQAQQGQQEQKPISESLKWTPEQLTPNERAQALAQGGIQPDPQGPPPPEEPQEAPQDPNPVTPDHLLQADQQQHQQSMDLANLAMQAQKQRHDALIAQQQNLQAQEAPQEQPGLVKRAVNKVRGK